MVLGKILMSHHSKNMEKESYELGYDAEDPSTHEKDAVRNTSLVRDEVLKHSHDEDEAMKAFAELEGVSLEIDESTNKRLRRLIDFNLVPIMCLVYGLNYLDKTTLSYANVMGLQDDIGLTGSDYSWLGMLGT